MASVNDSIGKLARVYDSSTDTWIPLIGAPAPHTHDISSLGLVQITNPQDGDVLVYSSSASAWINQQP
jgi:hypothetical protein